VDSLGQMQQEWRGYLFCRDCRLGSAYAGRGERGGGGGGARGWGFSICDRITKSYVRLGGVDEPGVISGQLLGAVL
jgi:hypothetical protein